MVKDLEKAKALIENLNERAKELSCIYNVEEILKDLNSPLEEVFTKILEVIHPGWQYTDICKARIIYGETSYTTEGFEETTWMQKASLYIGEDQVGSIEVFYITNKEFTGESPFLIEEQKLLNSISEKLNYYLFNRHLKEIFGEWDKAKKILLNLEKNETQLLKIFENANPETIETYLQQPIPKIGGCEELEVIVTPFCDKHWRWRLKIAGIIADKIDFDRYGIQGIYIFGSVKNAKAGPASDIDLLIHFKGNEIQEQMMKNWLDGWSLSLAEFNFLKTGYRTDGLLDYHIITDEDIKNRSSFAVKIGAITDAARPLRVS